MKIYHTVVVYSGSTCMCRSLRHTSRECGHKHKTAEAADRCLDKLHNWSKDRRSCCADWYGGQVVQREAEHNTDLFWREIGNDESELVSAYDACKC